MLTREDGMRIVVAASTALALAACSNEKATWVAECEKGGTTNKACACLYDTLSPEWRQVMRMDEVSRLDALTRKNPADFIRFTDAVSACEAL
jgi:hypothetical protein